jgi:Uma2 family endonuclease
MTRVLLLPKASKKVIRERRSHGLDRYDEVWNGVYVVSPIADNEHQTFGGQLSYAIRSALGDLPEILVVPGGLNISDRPSDWRKNYRIPDVSVFLPGNPAIDKGSHWLGGPDFAAEILSPGDRSRKKFGFYAAVNVRELLLVNRKPWRLELYLRQGDGWSPALISDLTDQAPIRSDVLGLTFRLLPGPKWPSVEVTRHEVPGKPA